MAGGLLADRLLLIISSPRCTTLTLVCENDRGQGAHKTKEASHRHLQALAKIVYCRWLRSWYIKYLRCTWTWALLCWVLGGAVICHENLVKQWHYVMTGRWC